jgi:cell division transport system ATP-binding protein
MSKKTVQKPQNIIEARKLTLSYDKENPIIKNCTFNIKTGDMVVITGKSGSGKSTLLKSFYGDIKVDTGSLKIYGREMNNITRHDLNYLRRQLGIIFQDYKLINEWTVQQNILLPLQINKYPEKKSLEQVDKLLRHVKLNMKHDSYPLELSGGEQQRVAVARALSHNPLMILADEPTGNLDDYSSALIWDLLRRANEDLNITVIVVTHRIPSSLGYHYRRLDLREGDVYEID